MPRTLRVTSNADRAPRRRGGGSNSREKFISLARSRFAQAVKEIDKLKPLGDARYDAGPDDYEVILSALRREIDEVEVAFKTRGKASTAGAAIPLTPLQVAGGS